MLLYRSAKDGGVSPKHVATKKELYCCISCVYVGSVNE